MRILTRSIFGELLGVFLFTEAALMGFFLLFGLVREAMQQSLGPAQIGQMVPFLLPDALAMTIPATALFAVSLVYGRMSAANEVIATKSLGINPWQLIVWPTLIPAAYLSVATVYIHDLGLGWGRTGIQRVVISSLEEIAYAKLRTDRSFRDRNFTITVKGVHGRRLQLPIMSLLPDGDDEPITITASEAELRLDPATDRLTAKLWGGTATVSGWTYHFDYEEREIPIRMESTSSPSQIPGRELGARRADVDVHLAKLDQREAARTTFTLLSGDLDALADPEAREALEAKRQYWYQQAYRLDVEPWRRWAHGFSCVCFVLVGVPLAIRLKNAGFLTSFALCFFPILVLYYPQVMLTVSRAKTGDWPAWAVWSGNVFLTCGGLWLMRRVVRN